MIWGLLVPLAKKILHLASCKMLNFTSFLNSNCSGVARGAGEATAPDRNFAPLFPPHEITLCTEVYGDPPF